jgi:hypothetical protein
VIVAADEEPGLAAGGDAAQLTLGMVVGESQAAIVVKSRERPALAMGITKRGTQQAATRLDLCIVLGHPVEEGIGVRAQMALAQRLDLARRLATKGAVELEDSLDAHHGLARDRILGGDRGLPELAPAVRPASDLVALAEVELAVLERRPFVGRLEQKIIDALGIGLDIAAETAKQLANGRRGLARHVLEKNVIGVRDLHQEMSRRHPLRGLSPPGIGCTSTPVASVAMQNAVRSASSRMAATTVAPTVAPASSAHRHMVPRSSGVPARAARSSWR